ncbi:MAG: ATP-grasp domain-containing protein, partial [Fimbriimonadales bacterium]
MPRVLVLALENWLGSARLPKALRSAGFEVSLLCYPNTLIALTKYTDDRDTCLPGDAAEIVARRMTSLIEAHPARMIIPADDRALRFLHHIVEVAHLGRLPQALIDVVRASLPNPSSFRYGVDKEAASQLMDDLGIRTPPRKLVWSHQDLKEFESEFGLPFVVKPLAGTAGEGVQILKSAEEIDAAMLSAGSTWMAQKYIRGKSAGSSSVAIDGKCLGTVAYEKTFTYPGETGPASVITRIDNEDMMRGARAFAKATG